MTVISIPCMGSVCTGFLTSLLALERPAGTPIVVSESSLIYNARNTLGQRALDMGAERILWLDSDMKFDADLFDRLSADLDAGMEYVCGIYFSRSAPVKPVIYKALEFHHNAEENTIEPVAVRYNDYPRDSVFEIKASGFGAVMMTTDAYKRVLDKFGQPFQPMLGLGEDLAFCQRAGDLGIKMYCDSRAKVKHIGLAEYGEQQYLEGE